MLATPNHNLKVARFIDNVVVYAKWKSMGKHKKGGSHFLKYLIINHIPFEFDDLPLIAEIQYNALHKLPIRNPKGWPLDKYLKSPILSFRRRLREFQARNENAMLSRINM